MERLLARQVEAFEQRLVVHGAESILQKLCVVIYWTREDATSKLMTWLLRSRSQSQLAV